MVLEAQTRKETMFFQWAIGETRTPRCILGVGACSVSVFSQCASIVCFYLGNTFDAVDGHCSTFTLMH